MAEAIQTKEEITVLLRKNAARLRAFGLKRIGLFGSFGRARRAAACQ